MLKYFSRKKKGKRDKMRIVFLASGPLGPRRRGNQSLKNTLLGFLNAGYIVYHFSLVSPRHSRFNFKGLSGHPGYNHFGMPAMLLRILRRINRPAIVKRNRAQSFPKLEDQTDLGQTEITWKQNLLIVVGTGFELLRMMAFALVVRPSMIYGYEVYGAFAAFFVSRLLGLKCILRFQGTYVTKRNMRSPVMFFHIRALSLPADGVVMANDGTNGDAVLRTLGINHSRVYFKPNGLDDQVIGLSRTVNAVDNLAVDAIRKRTNGSSSKYLIGVFTRFYPYKRIDRSIVLLSRFLREGASVHLLISGGAGPQEHALKELIRETGVSANVTWCGSIEYSEMASYYRACNIVFALSDYAFLGNQILEAVHLGVPLLALDDGAGSRLFGDCPYARFIGIKQLASLQWTTVEETIAMRHAPYESPHIRSWRARMEDEIGWIESLPSRVREAV